MIQVCSNLPEQTRTRYIYKKLQLNFIRPHACGGSYS